MTGTGTDDGYSIETTFDGTYRHPRKAHEGTKQLLQNFRGLLHSHHPRLGPLLFGQKAIFSFNALIYCPQH
jgi:hypothetical protein